VVDKVHDAVVFTDVEIPGVAGRVTAICGILYGEQFGRGGAKPPSRVLATWAGYKKAGPILFSTEHRGFADGKPLHIFISDVAVKLTGSDKWMPAQ